MLGVRADADPPVATTGVWVPSVVLVAKGVVAPELTWVAIEEASLREDSERSCLTFLLRRWEGFQCELRKGLGRVAMSRVSRSSWCSSVVAFAGGILTGCM